MPFATAYARSIGTALQVPLTRPRANSIYNTIARPIRKPNPAQKITLLNQLVQSASFFATNAQSLLQNQNSFDQWFFSECNALIRIPFSWQQAPKNGVATSHQNITLGIAQKLLNLALKDWWATNKIQGNNFNYNFLYAPLDSIVADAVSRYTTMTAISAPYYNLTVFQFQNYQASLMTLGNRLSNALRLPQALNRIECEQLIWGWV